MQSLKHWIIHNWFLKIASLVSCNDAVDGSVAIRRRRKSDSRSRSNTATFRRNWKSPAT